MNKQNPPNTLESLQPCSGLYSLRKDLKLNFWFFVATVTWVANLALAKSHPEWGPSTRAACALSPLVPGLLYLRSCMRFVGGLDELQRRVQLEAWLFAAIGTLLIGTAVNTLGSSGVRMGELEHGMGVGSAAILTFALWLVGCAVANRHYK